MPTNPLNPQQKAAFVQAGVPDQHHDQLHALGVTPEQANALQAEAAAAGIGGGQLIQLLLNASPQILAFIQAILALKKSPAPTPGQTPQQPGQPKP